VEKYGLKEGDLEGDDWDFTGRVLPVETDGQFAIEAKDLGFAERIEKSSVMKGYELAFRRMREANSFRESVCG